MDDFLAANYRPEEALCDGCLAGRLSIVLAEVATIAPILVHSDHEDDGGLCNTYEGTLTGPGRRVSLPLPRLRDRGGVRFLSDVSEFRAVEWQARLPLHRS